jgi:hypothetical protein
MPRSINHIVPFKIFKQKLSLSPLFNIHKKNSNLIQILTSKNEQKHDNNIKLQEDERKETNHGSSFKFYMSRLEKCKLKQNIYI